jgi:hypothetical protein
MYGSGRGWSKNYNSDAAEKIAAFGSSYRNAFICRS